MASVNNSAVEPFDQMISAYEKYGGDKYMIDEEIVQSSHVLQAAYIAAYAGAPEDVIVGLLFHDIGQIIDAAKVGDVNYLHAAHDEVGGAWLKSQGFPQDVVDWVRFHTIAKMVLCQEDPYYYEHLSLASQQSLEIQKEKYLNEDNQKTLTEFNNHPRRADYLRQRKCDDMAKITDFADLPSFENYRAMTLSVLKGNGKPAKNPEWREVIDALHTYMCEDRKAFENLMKGAVSA